MRRKNARGTGRRRPGGSWTLLVIDNEPIRAKALRGYHSAEKSVLRVRTEIENFESRDQPGFHRWEAAVFGSLLTEIREIEAATAEKRRFLDAVEEEAFWSYCSLAEAYRRVSTGTAQAKRASENMDEDGDMGTDMDEDETGFGEENQNGTGRMFGDSDLPPGFDADLYDDLPARDQKRMREDYARIAAMYEAVTGNPAPDFDEVLERECGRSRANGASPRDFRQHRQPPPMPEDDRIKTLYRRLVRQLHPDANPDHGWRERELWHEVQAAYQARDLERLEAAAGRAEIGLPGGSLALSVHLLLRMARDLRTALRGLKRQVRHARTHVAWNFSTRTKERPALEKQRRSELEKTKRQANSELAGVKTVLDRLAAQVEKRAEKPRRRSKPRPPVAEDPRQMAFF